MNRRHFLTSLGAASAALPFCSSRFAHAAEPAYTSQDFDFIFFTDTHLQPELNAAKGCDMAFKKMRGIKADFAIQGGDHVFDALGVPKERALSLFDLYDKTQQDLSVKVYHTMGNHDAFGVYPASGVAPNDPLYGKKYYQDHIGKTYYSFDHKGVHFVVLDSIGITDDRAYEGRVDVAQVQWLANDLKAVQASTPIIVSIHVPLVSSISSYMPPSPTPEKHHGLTVINASEIIGSFKNRNLIGVLQGHLHINELTVWHGTPYIGSGAVCGNWWQGTRLGAAEGYTVCSIRGGKLQTRYETYGFTTVDPHNT